MINDKQKGIDEDYLKLIKFDDINNSFEEINVQNTGYKYYISNHPDSIRTKRLYHFILNIY